MRRGWQVTIVVGLFAVVLATVIAGMSRESAEAQSQPHPNVLTGASPDAVARVALNNVSKDFAIGSGSPQVVLSRSIQPDDLVQLNLPPLPQTTIEEPPLTLVILRGDFANHKGLDIVHNGPQSHYKYVAYVYDLWAGTPTETLASPTGGLFRTALNDPSLPIEPSPVQSQVNRPGPIHHYGDQLPPMNPPQH